MRRIVLDANVLVSAAINRTGTPGLIVSEWRRGAFNLVVSPRLLQEVEDALDRPKLRIRTADTGHRLVSALRAAAVLIDDPPAQERIARDPGDDYLIALARAGGADGIVTGDHHVLDIEGLTPPAVTPSVFLTLLHALE